MTLEAQGRFACTARQRICYVLLIPTDSTRDNAILILKFNLIFLFFLILIAFITGNSSLEPLIEGLCAQIHVNLR